MITLQEFMDMCQNHDEVWVVQEGSLFVFKDKAIRIVHFNIARGCKTDEQD